MQKATIFGSKEEDFCTKCGKTFTKALVLVLINEYPYQEPVQGLN